MKKKLIKIASFLFPKATLNFAYKKLTQPQSKQLKKNETLIMDRAEKSRFKLNGAEIQIYEWHGEKEAILLVHGWEGQAGNFSRIIERLIIEKYTIISFDGPSHGLSSKSQGTSLFEFGELVGVIITKFQIKNIISHSFGAMATIYSLSKNPAILIDKYFILTTPNKFLTRLQVIAKQIGISSKIQQNLINRLEKELPIDLSTLSVALLCQEVNVKNALILHDLSDSVIGVDESKEVVEQWPISKLEVISGTGHFKILQSEKVLTRMVEYFSN